MYFCVWLGYQYRLGSKEGDLRHETDRIFTEIKKKSRMSYVSLDKKETQDIKRLKQRWQHGSGVVGGGEGTINPN